jgi:tripartite-type tricarboxylate transporter receptor subunit TctC
VSRICCIAFAVGLTGIASAQAQYPNKSVRMIVPYPPGGATDALGRVIGPALSEALGRPVVVENRPGAGTNLGAEIAAKSPPDGYTLLLGGLAQAISATLYSKLNYDFIRDFAPVSLLASTSLIMVVHPSLPAKSVKELIALARARPGQLDYVSSGSGSPAHLAAVLFTSMAGVKMNHIPYKGGSPAAMALIGGEASVGFINTPSVIQHVKSGRLRGLAITSAQRSPFTPDLPTISEMGVAGYEVGTWDGLLAPAGTPDEVISRLHAETVKALKRQGVKERLDASGIEPIGTTPEQFGAYIRSEVGKWAKVVKASGAHID